MIELGIDTGGTFTDAAVVRHDGSGRVHVLATAKALTTKGDLSVGVTEALQNVLQQLGEQRQPTPPISMITVSTTLATNAVVEGHGDRVGIVLIGFDDQMVTRIGIDKAFPDCPIVRVRGGHNHAGFELAPLDEAAILSFADTTAVGVKAFAVAALFGNRNPEHERTAAKTLARTTLPVSLSSDLTGALDAPRRALTAILNARLVGKISALITAVEESVDALQLNCPVMLVKGDGTRANAADVRLRPVETVMSGPAASTIGAAALSGLSDCIMSDVGGTTTDIAILQGGRPALTDEGSTVGGWRTLVRAADVRTHGLGGDSEVRSSHGDIVLGPQRVVPISLLATRFPSVIRALQADLREEATANALQGRFYTLPFATSGQSTSIDTADRELLGRLAEGPVAVRRLAITSRIGRRLEELRKTGLVVVSALTVSDAAHVLGKQTMWSAEAAEMAVQLAARIRLMRNPRHDETLAFAESILDAAVTQSGLAILDACTDSAHNAQDFAVLYSLVAKGHATTGKLHVSIGPTLPLVAVGGPAPLMYPEVGRRLGTEVVLLQHGAVANAVGAAIGHIAATVTINIEQTDGAFRLVGATGAQTFADLSEAIEAALASAQSEATRVCVARGAGDPTVTVTETRTYIPGRTDDGGLLSAQITAEAVGRPSLAVPTAPEPPSAF